MTSNPAYADGRREQLSPIDVSARSLDGHQSQTVRGGPDYFEGLEKVPDGLPASRTPEEDAVWAVVPYALIAALLVVVALGTLRIVRGVRAMKSEAVVLRLREARAARKSREEREREAELASEDERRLQTDLKFGCSDFEHAAWNHNGCSRVQFRSIGECMALIPDLVHERRLKAATARLLESNVPHLTIAGGRLHTRGDERARAEYLDSAPGALARGSVCEEGHHNGSTLI